jgi:hypothetical protein
VIAAVIGQPAKNTLYGASKRRPWCRELGWLAQTLTIMRQHVVFVVCLAIVWLLIEYPWGFLLFMFVSWLHLKLSERSA